MKNLFNLLVVICCSVSTFGQSQPLQNEEIKAAVMKISEHIRHNYVFEKKGNEIAAYLVQKLEEGKFNSVESWAEFAALSTEILQNYSNDGHLYVRHDAKTVRELLAPTDGGAESTADDPFFHSKEAREKNFGFEEVKVIKGNIGYMKLSEINISEKSLPTMFAAMELVAHTRELILDLRGNGGGGSEVGPVLESMFLPKQVKLLEFTSRGGQVTTSETVSWIQQKRYTNPLFILINKKTGSAAEALAFALQAKKRAIVVGQPSAGAANMNSWYVVNHEVYVSVSTGAPTLPGTETSWERKGVQPDHTVVEGNEIEDVLRIIRQRNQTTVTPSPSATNLNAVVAIKTIFRNARKEILLVFDDRRQAWEVPGTTHQGQVTTRNMMEAQARELGVTYSDYQLGGLFTYHNPQSGAAIVRPYYMALFRGYVDGKGFKDSAKTRWFTLSEAKKVIPYPASVLIIERLLTEPARIWGGAFEEHGYTSPMTDRGVVKVRIIDDFYRLK